MTIPYLRPDQIEMQARYVSEGDFILPHGESRFARVAKIAIAPAPTMSVRFIFAGGGYADFLKTEIVQVLGVPARAKE
jgi:hypothetical protein